MVPRDDLPAGQLVADRRLWLTADRSQVVEEGHPDARFIFCGPGRRISVENATRYGLVAVPPKARAKPMDKMRSMAENKAAESEEDDEPKRRSRKHG